jgi:glycosyltransferase involved in cell wall biosynthesis
LERKLKLQAKDLKLADRVLFLGNMLNSDVPKYLAISDVFVRPSLSEGLGNVFLEAMAAGLPVIGTKVGGILDFLKDSEMGLFCEVKNPQSIAEKIELILNDNNLRQKLIDNGRRLVEEKYNWPKIAQQMKIIFEKLIHG